MKVYISMASDRSFVQLMMLAQGGTGSGSKVLGDVVYTVGEGGERTFAGWTLNELLEMGEGLRDIEPKKVRRRRV